MSVQASLSLGAYDLKRYYTRSLAIAFLISLLFHLFLLGGKEVVDIVMGSAGEGEGENIVATGPVTLDEFKEEMKEEDQSPTEDVIPPPPPMAAAADIGTGSEGAMGNLVAAQNVVDGPDIADMSQINFANNLGGGDGGAAAFDPSKIDMPTDLKVTKPAGGGGDAQGGNGMDEFEHYEEQPKYDKGQLNALIEYPPSAKENGIEGHVTLAVRISPSGKPMKIVIRGSSNRIFEEAARKAANKMTYTPAIQNGHAVPSWLTFRVEFKFSD